jgi:hypothetical protein
MQDWPLVVSHVLEYAARWHPTQEIVCRTVEGPVVISSYADLDRRARLCALALQGLRIRCVGMQHGASASAAPAASAAMFRWLVTMQQSVHVKARTTRVTKLSDLA